MGIIVQDIPLLVYNFPMVENGSNLFEGVIIITYNPSQFSREAALSHYIETRNNYPGESPYCASFRLHLDRGNENQVFRKQGSGSSQGDGVEFSLNGSEGNIVPTDDPVVQKPVVMKETGPVTLSTPYLGSDKRWQSVGLTSAPLFLGSALKENGFCVRLDNLSLPAAKKATTVFGDKGVTGFTLFEDVFIPFKDFLAKFPPPSSVTTAAGGPMVTLNPLGSMYHLPEINLFVSGEGESVFPKILMALQQGDTDSLFNYRGFSYQSEGVILFSHISQPNTLGNTEKLVFSFDFADKKMLERGLEMNFSRGCRNNCIFCSKIQGKEYRTLPEKNIHQLLDSFSGRLEQTDIFGEESRAVNINDDDLLQNTGYAAKVFRILREHGYRIWGIQSSITSFFHKLETVREETLDIITDPDLYIGGKPLLWLGTDTFLADRSRRLGKPMPHHEVFSDLIAEFEKRNIDNYHYWITTDHKSGWEEVAEELIMISRFALKYNRFAVLPHAPFLIPYPSTPVFRQIIRSEEYKSRIHFRKILKGSHPVFRMELVDRVETQFSSLNRMLKNEALPGKKGFFDHLKRGEFREALICAYSFIREERISGEKQLDGLVLEGIRRAEEKVAAFITKLG